MSDVGKGACPECGEVLDCELSCPSRARFADAMTALCFSDDTEDMALFHETLVEMGSAEDA